MAPEQAQIDQQIINVKASFQDSGIYGYQLQSAFAKRLQNAMFTWDWSSWSY